MAETQTSPTSWEGFSFRAAVLAYERGLIERALADSGGVVAKAACLLGLNHRQTLSALIDARHGGLVGVRSPKRPRRKSIITKGKK